MDPLMSTSTNTILNNTTTSVAEGSPEASSTPTASTSSTTDYVRTDRSVEIIQPHQVTRTYTYEVDGKVRKVTRTWTNSGVSATKRAQLAQFFKDNEAELRASHKSIKALHTKYNDQHEVKVSYSMFYKHFQKYFT